MYGVHQSGNFDNQFFMLDLATHESTPLGALHKNYHFEAIEIEPTSGDLYALVGGDGRQQGKLFKIERETGQITQIGQTSTGREYIVSAAFAPDGTLWAFQKNVGLLNINLSDGSSTVNWSLPGKANWEGLAWDPANTYLYGSEGSKMYRGNPNNQKIEQLCGDDFLPNPTKALDFRFDGQLIGGWHNPATNALHLFEIDTSSCTTRPIALNTPYNKLESLAFEQCTTGGSVSGTVINGRQNTRQRNQEGELGHSRADRSSETGQLSKLAPIYQNREPVPGFALSLPKGIQLKLELDANQDGQPSLTSYTTTDENGNYQFVNLPIGHYRLFVGNSTDAVELEVSSDNLNPNIDMNYTSYDLFLPIAIWGEE